MKLTTKTFRTALAEVGKVIRGRTTLPAAACVKLSMADDDRLQLEATNFDAWITRKVECTEGIESVLVNHSLLSRLVDNITDESFEMVLDGSKLTLKAKAVSVINTLDHTSIASHDWTGSKPLAVNPVDLADGLEAVNWAAETNANAEEFKLTTVIDLYPTFLACAATTGRVLAVFKRPLICERREVVLPSALVNLVCADLREKNTSVSLTERQLIVQHDRGGASIKLSELKAFPYERLTTMRGKAKGTLVDREFLRRGCHYAMTLTGSSEKPALDAMRNGDAIDISCRGALGEFSESIEAVGEKLAMKVPAEQLDECLSKTLADEVCVITLPNATFIEAGDMLFAVSQLVNPNQAAQAEVPK